MTCGGALGLRFPEMQSLRMENEALKKALEPFALIGNAADYPKLPHRLDVLFEWCERAKQVLEGQG